MANIHDYVRIKITTAEIDRIINRLIAESIYIFDLTSVDSLTYIFSLHRASFVDAKQIFEKCGVSYKVITTLGITASLSRIVKRPVLLLGILLFILISCIVPGKIYFFRIIGNETISAEEILLQAENCGIHFGVNARKLRSEEVKNQLLGNLPQLQWLGVTTNGSVATIRVSERSYTPEREMDQGIPMGIFASDNGIITHMTVLKGTPAVKVGQSVEAGDLLVSGYTDCGITTRAEQAQAEVFAFTMHHLHILTPAKTIYKRYNEEEETCYRFRIGKKVINLCNHSGIQATTCDKMYKEDYMSLPGEFKLPVSLTRIYHKFGELSEGSPSDGLPDWLQQYAKDYLYSQMVAGDVMDETLQMSATDLVYVLTGDYFCREIISKSEYEEINEYHAENN